MSPAIGIGFELPVKIFGDAAPIMLADCGCTEDRIDLKNFKPLIDKFRGQVTWSYLGSFVFFRSNIHPPLVYYLKV